MYLATPIIICNQNEDFRSLLREMLTKNGFFHILEASSGSELLELISREKKPYFLVIQSALINEEVLPLLTTKKNFIIIAQPGDETALPLAARFGVRSFMSFPFSSQNLLDKIQELS